MKTKLLINFLIVSLIFVFNSCGTFPKEIKYDFDDNSVTVSEEQESEMDFNPFSDPSVDIEGYIDPTELAEGAGADSKVTALAELAVMAELTDIFYVIDDPSGTPVSKKITRANILGIGAETDFASNMTEYNVEDFRIGDGGANYVKFSGTGITFVGNYDMTVDLSFEDADTSPSSVGEFRYDNTVAGLDDGAMCWYDDDEIKYFADYATLPTTNGQFLIYNATSDKFVPLVMSGDATMDQTGAVTVAASGTDMDGTPSSSGTYTGLIVSGVNAGETITAGDIVYMDGTSNEWMLTDANVTGEFPAIGMAAESGTNGNPMDVLIRGVARLDSWSWTNEGVKLYLSETPGDMTETAPSDDGDCVQVLATVLAITTDTILFNADTTWFLDDGS